MTRTIFTAGLLVDGTGRRPIVDPYVLVEEGRILEIGSGRPPRRWHRALPQYPAASPCPRRRSSPAWWTRTCTWPWPRAPDWPEINADPTRMALPCGQGGSEDAARRGNHHRRLRRALRHHHPLARGHRQGPGAGIQVVGLRGLAHRDQWPRLLLD